MRAEPAFDLRLCLDNGDIRRGDHGRLAHDHNQVLDTHPAPRTKLNRVRQENKATNSDAGSCTTSCAGRVRSRSRSHTAGSMTLASARAAMSRYRLEQAATAPCISGERRPRHCLVGPLVSSRDKTQHVIPTECRGPAQLGQGTSAGSMSANSCVFGSWTETSRVVPQAQGPKAHGRGGSGAARGACGASPLDHVGLRDALGQSHSQHTTNLKVHTVATTMTSALAWGRRR